MSKAARKPVRLGSVSERVYADLLREMEMGVLAANARLPTEYELCDRFGASRTAVRRALKRLSSEGRIESRQGSGSYVRERPAGASTSNTISVMFLGSTAQLTRLQDLALQRGYVVAFYSQLRSGWEPSHEALFLEQVKQQRHKALIAFCSPREPHNDELLDAIERGGVSVVHVEYYRPAPPTQSHVLLDYERGAHVAAVTLMLAGYDRIVLATMSGGGPFCRLHERGFLEALAEHRGGDRKLVDYTRSRERGTWYDIARPETGTTAKKLDAFVESLPPNTGVVCGSHGWAEWVIDACARRKRRVPDDVGVMSLDTAGDVGEPHPDVDHISFGDRSLYEIAIEEVCRPDFAGVRRLLPPHVIRGGTVRGS